MEKIKDWIGRHIVELMVLFFLIHATLPILSPIAFRLGIPSVGRTIQYVYKYLCHQRVDRSIFMFSEVEESKGLSKLARFYTVEDLQEYGVIPEVNPYSPIPAWNRTFFGYPYYGNDEVGYKVAYCIRDTSIYTTLSVSSLILYVWLKRRKKNIKVPLWVLAVFMLPMAIDGLFQLSAEWLALSWVPEVYFTNNVKRIVTGVLFGIGFALFVIPSLKKSTDILYTETNDETNEN